MTFKAFFLFLALTAFSSQQNHFSNFGKGSLKKHFYEIMRPFFYYLVYGFFLKKIGLEVEKKTKKKKFLSSFFLSFPKT